MSERPTQVAVLGSTGSIGRSTLDVIAGAAGQLRALALAAHTSTERILAQARLFRPRWVVVTNPEAAARQDWSELPPECELLTGPEAISHVARAPETDVVLSAIVGSAGLEGTWAAVEAGKRVALANKESLVMGGPLVTRMARSSGATILPVDSEHSAVFQALQAGRREDLRQVVLTASGGPFRKYTLDQLAGVTIQEALAHPTWEMGPKITIDSATLMNKALEIIEARWLFDLRADQIGVVIHPQSIIHSMVEYVDGSVIAQLSPPDMRLPIQLALSWPERRAGVAEKMDWTRGLHLDLEPPDFERFAALKLGLEVARVGGTAGAVLNASNETAVAAFLSGALGFEEIVPACKSVLENHHFDPNPTLGEIRELDRWARRETSRWVCA